MAEDGSWWPKSWHEAIPNTVWGILALGFGLDFVTNVIAGNYGHALVALIGLGALIAVLVHRDQFKALLQTLNPNWIVAVFVVFLQVLVLSPFVEQHRWPFSYPDPQLVAENQRLRGQLASVQPQAEQLRFVHSLRNGTKASNGEHLTCSFTLGLTRDSQSEYFWALLQPLLDFAHWNQVSNNVDASQVTENGISILVGSDKSDAFTCGTALARQLQSAYEFKVRVLSQQMTPALIACDYKCVELDIGHLNVH
ncbi:MAG TPA: hypothetical protein VEK73_02675 [Xanthobacteraceae bacterium]|nr:hypothetical protein [Xanthobacteraceae bacterium]